MNITIRIARRLVRKPAPRRDVIGLVLLHRIEWTDKHPLAPLAGLVVTAVIGALVNGWLK